MRDNPGGEHETLKPFSLETALDLLDHLDLTAKAAPSRGGGCSPDLISSRANVGDCIRWARCCSVMRVDPASRLATRRSVRPELLAETAVAGRGAFSPTLQFSSGDRLGKGA